MFTETAVAVNFRELPALSARDAASGGLLRKLPLVLSFHGRLPLAVRRDIRAMFDTAPALAMVANGADIDTLIYHAVDRGGMLMQDIKAGAERKDDYYSGQQGEKRDKVFRHGEFLSRTVTQLSW
jgi:hypothetical protein